VSLPVFHYPLAATADVGAEIHISGSEGHHAATVKRLRPGEAVVLTDGMGHVLDTEVTGVGRRELSVLVRSSRSAQRPALHVTVVQALPKGDRGELAIELMTEVGVDRFVPWQAERCVSRWQADKAAKGRAKWQTTASASARQSRRVWWPDVTELASTDAVAALIRHSTQSWVLHETAATPMVCELAAAATPLAGEITLVVGPEGGVSPAEVETLTNAGATPVRLGETVLRASTAGVVAATLVLARTEGWAFAPASDEGITDG
jgi:16S rRNA (uracil1498-N3)-methyltransferase